MAGGDGQKPKPKVNISVRVDPDTLEAFDALAEEKEWTRSDMTDKAMREYVEKHGSPGKPGKKS